LLRHRDERHSLGVKELDQPGKIGERAGQPVDFVDDDNVDPAGPDIGEQVLANPRLARPSTRPLINAAGPQM
jgi:hypothetical protein